MMRTFTTAIYQTENTDFPRPPNGNRSAMRILRTSMMSNRSTTTISTLTGTEKKFNPNRPLHPMLVPLLIEVVFAIGTAKFCTEAVDLNLFFDKYII